MKTVLALFLAVAFLACGGSEEGGTPEISAESEQGGPAAASPPEEAESSGLLCDRIEEDDILTPPGAETLPIPGIQEANDERRCLLAVGVSLPMEEVRAFTRSGLADLGFALTHDEDTPGAGAGNVSRTFLVGASSTLGVSVVIDEFEPGAPISDYPVALKLQFDEIRD